MPSAPTIRTIAALLLGTTFAIGQTCAETIEVRLVAEKGGTPFSFADGTTFQLERWTMLRTSDFKEVVARPTRNQNNPGKFDVIAHYTPRARAKFVGYGERDRDRRYCVLIGKIIDNCSGFPPIQKPIFDVAQSLTERAPDSARRLARALNVEIAAISARDQATDRASLVSPKALLDVLNHRAVANRQPLWIDREERETFLSHDLQALWRKADAIEEAGNEDEIYDADPIAATNGLTMKTYRIDVKSSSATHAAVNVLVGYAEKQPSRTVRYDLVREHGHWRITNIGGDKWSLRASLEEFVAPAPKAGDNK